MNRPHRPMRCRPAASIRRERARGASLIEVLVAVLILSLGLLGLAGMQLRALRGSVSSVQRTQAVVLGSYMLDLLRVDRVAALRGDYNTPGGTQSPLCDRPSADSGRFAQVELQAWFDAVKQQIGRPADRTTCAVVSCIAAGPCAVHVQWDDSASGGLPQQSVVLTTRL